LNSLRRVTERFGDFKPREHNMLRSPIAETVFEPRVGGHIYDRGEDGTECHWARILAFDPPDRVVFSWDIGPTRQVEQDPATPARSTSGSSPRHPSGPGSSWNTATSTGTAPAGNRSATASATTRAGRFTWPATPASSPRRADMPPTATSIDVDRSAAEVFAYATDPTRCEGLAPPVASGNTVPRG
jgi:uncharacterized protein YndB with AHSA1/START domain